MSRRVRNPDACVSAEVASQAIPVDQLLDRAIVALSVCDASGLRALEALAPRAAAPLDWARCRRLRAVYAALLAETARNLRMVRRVSARADEANPYRFVGSMSTVQH